MMINNKEITVNEALNYANFDNILLRRRSNSLLLSDYQIEILSKNNIDYSNFSSIQQLLFEIEKKLNCNYDDELDFVSSQLAELSYYKDTKK